MATSATDTGYAGLDKATPKDGMDLKTMVEKSTGRTIDASFYDKSNPNYAANQTALTRATNAMYGDVGANLDARNWTAIRAAADPIKAAEDALKAMYNDKAYLAANTDTVLAQGYLPEQADITYKQMEKRVGSTYDSTWSKGTKYEGKIDSAGYMAGLTSFSNNPDAAEAFTNSYWAKYGGNPKPKLATGGNVVDTGTSNINTSTSTSTAGGPVYDPAGKMYASAALAIAAGVTNYTRTKPADTVSAAVMVYGPDGKSYASPAAATAAGVTNYTTTKPAGLIATAESAPPINTDTRGFMSNDSAAGNSNPGGLISGSNKQLFNPVTKINLPTGVKNPFSV
jgi:hypothetical protein